MRKNNGITLIALVVTIIVLLILAGVTISMLLNQNGIFGKAQEARTNTEISQEKEEVGLAYLTAKMNKPTNEIGSAVTVEQMNEQLDQNRATASDGGNDTIIVTYKESNRRYQIDQQGKVTEAAEEELNWDEILNNATKHPDQTTSEDIGVGTDGKPVNLDLWIYKKNSQSTGYLISNSIGCGIGKAYTGDFVDGKIIGKMPKYIKDDTKNWLEVKGIRGVFIGCSELVTAPEIPDTVEDMSYAFADCTNLIAAPEFSNIVINISSTFSRCEKISRSPIIPDTVKHMSETFKGCSNLTQAPQLPKYLISLGSTFEGCTKITIAPKIPDTVDHMNGAFRGCSSLIVAPEIPPKVDMLMYTFSGCTSLTTPPSEISDKIIYLSNTFEDCTNLSGTIKINANPSDYGSCFKNASTNPGTNLVLGGSSSKLDAIIATKSANSNITKGE